jgi:hypothetical protein
MGKVFYADLWGLREGKYRYLLESDISTTSWQELEPVAPYFFFVPKDLDLFSEYERGWSVADIFLVNSTGIRTHRDHFVVDFEEERLRSRIAEFRDEALSDDEVRERFKLRDTPDWKLPEARAKLQAQDGWDKNFNYCLYRPFDLRPIYYSGDVIDRPRPEVMHHMLRENKALLTMRRIRTEIYAHFLVTKSIVGKDVVSVRDSCNVFPLYLYTTPEDTEGTLFAAEEATREPNLSPKFIATVKEKLGLEFVPDDKGDLQSTFGPEDIFHYIYAVFHSPTYRDRYAELLKIDFPRVPLTSNCDLFRRLCALGEKLVSLHLLESSAVSRFITYYPIPGDSRVEKGYPKYLTPGEPEPGTGKPLEQGRVYINKTQYFAGVSPEVWEFQIGGYQVCHKWLKDRQGRQLSYDDLTHYQKVIVALSETICLMEEIDEAIPDWPIQ